MSWMCYGDRQTMISLTQARICLISVTIMTVQWTAMCEGEAAGRRWRLTSDEYKYERRRVGPSGQHEQRPRDMKKYAMFELLAPTSFLRKVKWLPIHRTWRKKSQDLNKIRWWQKTFKFKQKMQSHNYGSFKLLLIKSIYSNKHHLGL